MFQTLQVFLKSRGWLTTALFELRRCFTLRGQRKVSKDDYENSVDEFMGIIEGKLAYRVVSVYAAGSFARGDYTLLEKYLR